jgi:hypothetical protein
MTLKKRIIRILSVGFNGNNNKFIPHVVSDKILKLQHQKELVLEAMLNF